MCVYVQSITFAQVTTENIKAGKRKELVKNEGYIHEIIF